MNKAFSSTPMRSTKSSGSSSNMTIGKNGNTARASQTKPAPLVKRCASCGRKK
jgi:hypothetical protein